VASDGGLFSFAPPGVTPDFYGSMGGQHLNAPIVGMVTAAASIGRPLYSNGAHAKPCNHRGLTCPSG